MQVSGDHKATIKEAKKMNFEVLPSERTEPKNSPFKEFHQELNQSLKKGLKANLSELPPF